MSGFPREDYETLSVYRMERPPVDLDLSEENLFPGQQLALGTAVIEITAESHTGCHKFAARFGKDALRFVNSEIGRSLNLRGIYARVVRAGLISVGDVIRME